MLPELSQDEVLRYTRHLIIPDVGMEGQRKLKAASVLIVGAGGLGSPLALYLAAAGIGHIGVVDYDVVDSSNLQRQVIHSSAEIGKFKAESAKKRMLEINPYIQVDSIVDAFTSENAPGIAEGYDILADGTDNFPTRYLINDLCVMTGKPYVYGSIFRFEGQVSVFDARQGPCYRCLFPEPPPPGMTISCNEGGVFGILPGTVGTLQATEVLKLVLGIGKPLIGTLLLYDALESEFHRVRLRKNPTCILCGPEPRITQLVDYEEYCGVPLDNHLPAPIAPENEIEPSDLAQRLQSGAPLQLVDVRQPVEQQISCLPGALNIPYQQLDQHLKELDPQREIVLYCRTGVRSARAVSTLLAAGFKKVYSLRGGINAWARLVDPKMFQY